MQISFSQTETFNTNTAPPLLTLTTINPDISSSLASIRLVFKAEVPQNSHLNLFNTIFTATNQTMLPFGFNANTPALSLQALLNFYAQFNDYTSSPENTHTLIITALYPGLSYLPDIEQLLESPAIETVEVIRQGLSENPYFNPLNKLIIQYNTGLKYSKSSQWLKFNKVQFQKVFSFNSLGTQIIPTFLPDEINSLSKIPKAGLIKNAFNSLQLDAYLQEENGAILKIAVSEPLLFLPTLPSGLDITQMLPNPEQIGQPLNGGECKTIIENTPPIPLYFIIPETAESYINPTAGIEITISTFQANTLLSFESAYVGTYNQPGLYSYWLNVSDFTSPSSHVIVKVISNSQILYQSAEWEFKILPNTNPCLTLGYNNTFGLPAFLNIPIQKTEYKANGTVFISLPMPFSKSAINQWTASAQKWIIENQKEVPNTINKITFIESTDLQLTLILESNA